MDEIGEPEADDEPSIKKVRLHKPVRSTTEVDTPSAVTTPKAVIGSAMGVSRLQDPHGKQKPQDDGDPPPYKLRVGERKIENYNQSGNANEDRLDPGVKAS